MNHDTRRITLISRDGRSPERDWDQSPSAPSRAIILDSMTVLRYAVGSRLVDMDLDVERVILDRSASAADFLSLLAELPPEFRGDILLINDDDGGFLSATGRGGDRVLYSLSATDLRFYLEANALVTERSGEESLPLPILALSRRRSGAA